MSHEENKISDQIDKGIYDMEQQYKKADENSNLPAFSKSAFYHPDGGVDSPQTGLSKREYFAILALQGLCAASANLEEWGDFPKTALLMADGLLKQLENAR